MLAMGMGAPSYGGGDLTHYGYTVGYSQAATEQGSPDPGPFLQQRGALQWRLWLSEVSMAWVKLS